MAEPLPLAPGEWTRFVPVETEIDGKLFQPTCSGFPGTNSEFHFWAKRGTADKLVIFFEGGGACWDGMTCSLPIDPAASPDTPQLYAPAILPGNDPRALDGLFDTENDQNPVHDWSYVYVPYCTGDVHAGSVTQTYTSPFNGEAFQIEHRGADNFRVVLKWIERNFRSPEQVFVAGSSAGAYGAAAHYPEIRDVFRSARASMLADAGQAVVPESFSDIRSRSWNMQLRESVFGPDAASAPGGELADRLAQHYPDDRFAQYTTSLDLVQMGFYDVMVNGLAGSQGAACRQWSDIMRAELAERERLPNFRSYVGAGVSHMILPGNDPGNVGVPLFYRESSGGDRFPHWLDSMLSPSGAGWVNRSCTNCDTLPIPCPL